MYNTENKILICQLQNAKSNFPTFYRVYARQKTKNKKSDTFINTFSRNLCFNPYFKNRFPEDFFIKVIETKKIHYLRVTL